MVESRCGIKCSECECKVTMNCKGCVNIDKPFWGECDLKTCSESKSHCHCGDCSEFPCETLHAYSYDEEQGDNGKRIEQCRNWAANDKVEE